MRPVTSQRTTECRWCGKPLRERTTVLMGKTIRMGFEQCQCIGAKEECRRAAKADAEAAQKSRESRLKADLGRAGVLPRYDTAQHPKAALYADSMAEGKWLYLWGEVGTGKTTCAMAVTAELVKRGKRPRIVPMRQILHEIQRSFHDGSDPMGQYLKAPFLLLDDLGKESPTAFALERTFALIDDRYSRLLPTAITTQYKPSDLVQRLAAKGDFDTAQAIVSRLREGAVVEHFGGGDRRLA